MPRSYSQVVHARPFLLWFCSVAQRESEKQGDKRAKFATLVLHFKKPFLFKKLDFVATIAAIIMTKVPIQ